MSRGKYSPCCPHANEDYDYKYNCFGEIPERWTKELGASGVVYNEQTMFGNYDSEGFDSYGYSAFDANRNYVGVGAGIDRLGKTESDYLGMIEDDYDDVGVDI